MVGDLAGPRSLASPVCGVWAGESQAESCPAVIHRFWSIAAEAPRPRVAARDDLSRFVAAVMLVLEFGAREEPAGCVQRMISFRERRSGLPGQRHGCVGLGLCRRTAVGAFVR